MKRTTMNVFIKECVNIVYGQVTIYTVVSCTWPMVCNLMTMITFMIDMIGNICILCGLVT